MKQHTDPRCINVHDPECISMAEEPGHCMKNEGTFGIDYYTRAQGRNTLGIDCADGFIWSGARLLDLVCGLVWLWGVGIVNLGEWTVCTRRFYNAWGWQLAWYGVLVDVALLAPKILFYPCVYVTSRSNAHRLQRKEPPEDPEADLETQV